MMKYEIKKKKKFKRWWLKKRKQKVQKRRRKQPRHLFDLSFMKRREKVSSTRLSQLSKKRKQKRVNKAFQKQADQESLKENFIGPRTSRRRKKRKQYPVQYKSINSRKKRVKQNKKYQYLKKSKDLKKNYKVKEEISHIIDRIDKERKDVKRNTTRYYQQVKQRRKQNHSERYCWVVNLRRERRTKEKRSEHEELQVILLKESINSIREDETRLELKDLLNRKENVIEKEREIDILGDLESKQKEIRNLRRQKKKFKKKTKKKVNKIKQKGIWGISKVKRRPKITKKQLRHSAERQIAKFNKITKQQK